MTNYLLGLFTIPAVVLAFVTYVRVVHALAKFFLKHGYFVEWHGNRAPEEISDYTLSHDIWFERSRGPIYTGHWCRLDRHKEKTLATRWIGFGRASGRSVTFYKVRTLK